MGRTKKREEERKRRRQSYKSPVGLRVRGLDQDDGEMVAVEHEAVAMADFARYPTR